MERLSIPKFSEKAANAARERLDSLAKLPGSLGRLEELAARLAGITGQKRPTFPKKTVVLFAGDHGIAKYGLSTSGSEVTALQVRNFLHGGGAINAFCRTAGADLRIVDVGVCTDLEPELDTYGLIRKKIMYGTHDFTHEPAMTRNQAEASVQIGIDMAREEAARGTTLLAAGEMGIGNTTPSSAIIAVLGGFPLESVIGTGSGISSNEILLRKRECVRQGIEINKPNPADALDVLAKVGGLEIGAMAGLMLGGASLRIPVIVDGFIAGAAAMIAVGINPAVQNMLTGSHLSTEPGHRLAMDHLGIPVCFKLGMRLGEGTGAVLLFPMIDSAVRILREMNTLNDIGFQHFQSI